MNTLFEKTYSKNYIVLEDFPNYSYENDYQFEMLKNNSIPGGLPLSIELKDNCTIFKYDITSKQSFSSLFANTKITYKAYISIILSLIDIVGFLEEYLIDINTLIIRPQYIYLDPEKYTTYFTICPAFNDDFYKELNVFFNDILNNTDHNDDSLVLLAYNLASESGKDGFNISQLKNIVYSRLNESPTSILLKSKDRNSILESEQNSNTTILKESISYYTATAKPFINEDISNDSHAMLPSIQRQQNTGNKLNLSTFSKPFVVKMCLAGFLILILSAITIFAFFNDTFSSKLAFIFLAIDAAFILGSIRYFLELYPSAKEPYFKERKLNPPTIKEQKPILQTEPKASTSEAFNFDTSLSSLPEEEFGDTILLSKTNITAHRLVYTGTDFTQEAKLSHYPFTIGKLKASVNMVISNPLISRIHACIYFEGGAYFLEDLNSANGTYINGSLLSPHEKKQINPGDKLTFSHLTYIYE